MRVWKIVCIVILLPAALSCTHKSQVMPAAPDGNYPPAIAQILVSKCATAGCHNQASYANANNLLLDTWEHCMNGGANGAEVIPYNTQYSPLLYTVNTDPAQGPIYLPTMPLSSPARAFAPLSTQEYQALCTWIKNGAPDKNGNVAFAADADTRQKIYMLHSGCDKIIDVIDAKTSLIMRCINIGTTAGNVLGQTGHTIAVSPDGFYAYISILGCRYVQQIDTRIDTIVGQADVSGYRPTEYAVARVSPDGNSLLVSNLDDAGTLLLINTAGMTVVNAFFDLHNPHGVAYNAAFDTFL